MFLTLFFKLRYSIVCALGVLFCTGLLLFDITLVIHCIRTGESMVKVVIYLVCAVFIISTLWNIIQIYISRRGE
jgi:FtsH-binding integral membrane protein